MELSAVKGWDIFESRDAKALCCGGCCGRRPRCIQSDLKGLVVGVGLSCWESLGGKDMGPSEPFPLLGAER